MRKPNPGVRAYELVNDCANNAAARWIGMTDKERRTNATGPILKISPATFQKLQGLTLADLAGLNCLPEKATALVLGLSDRDEGISLRAITRHFGGLLGLRAVLMAD